MSRDSEKLTERAPSPTPHTPTCRWPAQTTRLGPLATSRPRDAKHEPDPTRSGLRRGSDFTGDRVQDCRRVPYGDRLSRRRTVRPWLVTRMAAFAVSRRRGGTGPASHGGRSCQNPVERSAREVLLGPRWCPGGYGCRRLTSAVCLECARKLFAGRTFWLVTGLRSVVCKSITKASKVRILHLPPRAPEGL